MMSNCNKKDMVVMALGCVSDMDRPSEFRIVWLVVENEGITLHLTPLPKFRNLGELRDKALWNISGL